MNKNEIIERSRKFVEPYCVTDSKKFRLKDVDPGDTGEATSEDKPRLLEGIHGSLRGYDLQHGHRLRAMVRGACRQQVVRPGCRRGGCH